MFCRVSLNPRSNSRSASSKTSISKDDCGQCTWGDESNSKSLPGVATKRFGERFKKLLRFSAGVVEPPRRSCGTTLSVDEEYFVRGASSSVSEGLIAEADGGWNASNDNSTLYICEASSLAAG